MIEVKKENMHKQLCVVQGVFLVLAFYFTWCVSTISYMGKVFSILHLVCTGVTTILYVVFVYSVKKNWKKKQIINEIKTINFMLLIAFGVITSADLRERSSSIFLVLSDLFWIIATGFICYVVPINLRDLYRCTCEKIKNNCHLIVLIVVAMPLAMWPTMLQFKWDGALYTQAVQNMSIHSLSSLGAYGHLSQGYGVLICITRMIVGDLQYSMAVLNLCLYVTSIIAFYGILKSLIVDGQKKTWIIGTMIYSFSPYILGMVNYYSVDYAMQCLFICMLYFLINKKWILQFVIALFACFTKEPAIIAYFGVCIGIVLTDGIKLRGNIIERVKILINKSQYYLMVLIGLLWMVTFVFLAGWSGGGEFTGNYLYMLNKCKVLYLFNFNWFFTITIMIGSGIILFKKLHKKYDISCIVAMLCSVSTFTLFSIMYKTVNHARYVAPVTGMLYICAILVLYILLKEIWVNILLALISFLLVVSSFTTIDPVSKMIFRNLNVGNGIMLTTGDPIVGDSMIYNKQMLGVEYALNIALADAVKNDYMILLPTYDNNPNLFDGLMGEYEEYETYWKGTIFWNRKDTLRSLTYEEGSQVIELYELKDSFQIEQVKDREYGKRCFVYSDILGKEIADNIKAVYTHAEIKEYEYGIWKIYSIVF